MYSPCVECKLRYNKEYSAECDNNCDYANVCRRLKSANNKLEDYYNQQKNNDYFSDDGKRVICRVIENCQKIVNDIFESVGE